MVVDLDKLSIIARGIKASASMVDVEPVCAAGRKLPLRERAQIGQARHQDHRWLADAEEQPLRGGVRHAPARPSGQVERRGPAMTEAKGLQRRRFSLVADAGGNAECETLDDHRAV